jgi:hypothetical protein
MRQRRYQYTWLHRVKPAAALIPGMQLVLRARNTGLPLHLADEIRAEAFAIIRGRSPLDEGLGFEKMFSGPRAVLRKLDPS